MCKVRNSLPPVFVLMLFQFALALSCVFSASAVPNHPQIREGGTKGAGEACRAITKAISSASSVYYPDSPQYLEDIYHWAASSTESSTCVVEPGTAEDVGKILGIVADCQTPFAVKSGGHATNPGFSSTTGVHIAMRRFNEVKYDADTKTATIGTGLIWDEVYAALEPHGVNVVGGRVSGVGVGGFVLGGGYSWKTNQYGLAVDNVLAYELVLPRGDVVTVTEDSEPELFFGLKGGLNNFGIVTKFTMKAYPQSQVWGGIITYTLDEFQAVSAANIKFAAAVTDPKASTIVTFNSILGFPLMGQLMFYDAPNPPPGIFDDFLAIRSATRDISTRSFLSLVQSGGGQQTNGIRQSFHSVPFTSVTPGLISAVLNETFFWARALAPSLNIFVSYAVEPLLPTILTHSTSPSAYPPTRSRAYFPMNILFSWIPPSSDQMIRDVARASARQIKDALAVEGQNFDGASVYPNYAIAGTPLNELYGDNVEKLKQLKDVVDPDNVMGLTGGFKF